MKAVIGSGISGLAVTLYQNDCICFGEKVPDEGRTGDPFTFIHKTKDSVAFIKDINEISSSAISGRRQLSESVHLVNVRIPAGEISHREIAIAKTSQQEDAKILGLDSIAGVVESDQLSVLGESLSQITHTLELLVCRRRVYTNVKAIDRNSDDTFFVITTDDKKHGPFESIVSTIPFNIFSSIFPSWTPGDQIIQEDHHSITTVYAGTESAIFYPSSGPFKKVVYNAIEHLSGFEPIESSSDDLVRKGSRFSGKIKAPPSNVYFVGRFATAQSNWRIEDSIFVAKRGFLLSEVIKEQKRFNEALEVRLPRGVEREQDLLLHLFSEVAELQRELRWKRNRPKRKDRVKTTSVLEESVDCVKVILSILEGHSITERALMEAFEKKNRVVWLRFVEEFYGV